MAAITPLEEIDLEALLSRYGLSGLERYWPASNGIENSNYFVSLAAADGARELVLTLLEQPANAGNLLVPLLDHCDAAGLPIARVVRNRAGQAQDQVNGKPAILSPRLAGEHVVNPTSRQCEAVGGFLGHFHRATASLSDGAPAYPRDAAWLVRCAERVQPGMPYADSVLLESALTTAGSLLNRKDVAGLPRGIIHGDMFRDNVLFTRDGLSGVLDFHHAAVGTWIYDLAVAANDWCSDGDGTLDHDRVMALLRGYHDVRRLKLQELWFFPVYALYAATVFWLSRLVACSVEATGERTKNPEEFRRIVHQHTCRFFYVDPRLLH